MRSEEIREDTELDEDWQPITTGRKGKRSIKKERKMRELLVGFLYGLLPGVGMFIIFVIIWYFFIR